jgi:capsule polysaccharide export protein KpsE/RkpR
MIFSELESLMSSRGVTSLADIARVLSTTPQAVSNWKARNQVPYHIVAKIKEGPSLSKVYDPTLYTTNNIYESPIIKTPLSLSTIIIGIIGQLKFIILTFITFLFITFIYIKFIKPPLYISSSSFILPSSNSKDSGGLTGLAEIARSYGVNVNQTIGSDMSSSPALLPELIMTRTFSKRILETPFYTKKHNKKLSLLAILVGGENVPNMNGDQLLQIGMANLQTMIKLQTGKTLISTLEVETFEPELAAEINRKILYELGEINKLYRFQNIDNTINYLENRISSVEVSLNKFEQDLKRFRETNRQITTSPALQLNQGRLITNVDIQKGIYLTLKQQLELARIDRLEESSALKIIDNPIIPLYPSNKNTVLSLLLSLLFCFLVTMPTAFINGYYLKTENDKRKKLIKINKILIKSVKNIFLDKTVLLSLSILLLVGLPFFITWESQSPIYFNRYSLKALIIIIFYIITMLGLGLFSIVKFFREKKATL